MESITYSESQISRTGFLQVMEFFSSFETVLYFDLCYKTLFCIQLFCTNLYSSNTAYISNAK